MRLFRFTLILLTGMSSFRTTLTAQRPVYADKPFQQEYAVNYYSDAPGLQRVGCDRNGSVNILSAQGLLRPDGGQFLHPGKLLPDRTYRTLKNRKIAAITVYDEQLVYLDDTAVLSNAWAGQLNCLHALPNARMLVGGRDFTFLISDGSALHLVGKAGTLWKGQLPGTEVLDLCFSVTSNRFWILASDALFSFSPGTKTITRVFSGSDLTAFDLVRQEKIVLVGTRNGYLEVDAASGKKIGSLHQKLPVPHITSVAEIDGRFWFGSPLGAFSLRSDGKFDYYNGERWLPGNEVTHIAAGPGNSVLVLTSKGLGQLSYRSMTLYDKALFFEEQVRSRHIRNGFNASLAGMDKGNPATGYLSDSDNDGLWTSMYLASQAFRYAVTKDRDALQNCRESLDAMQRLFTINPVPGFPARSFERSGFREVLADSDRWQASPQPGWDWKATTSSDEAIGHLFAYGVVAELIPDRALRTQAVQLMDTLMSHIVKNDLYLIDFNGKPTTWGRWNPAYVNSFPPSVGDRKLNSSNIISMLQTAYRFTGKEKYRLKAFELMQKHGYLENLLRPMSAIGRAPADADKHAQNLSDGWNHSDDEMYFLGYWGLYRYAFDDALKAQYKKAILDHWQAERPEKEGLWNIFTAMTGVREYDRSASVEYLQQHPLDLIDWAILNSHRKDIEPLPANFRSQTIREVLPPDERPIQRHNANMFILDRNTENGTSEHSAGDIWLLPYWMGRYLGVIGGPAPSISAQPAFPKRPRVK